MKFEEGKQYTCYTCSIAAVYEFEGASDGCYFSFDKETAPCANRANQDPPGDGECCVVEGVIRVIQKIDLDPKICELDSVFPFAKSVWGEKYTKLHVYPAYINPSVLKSYTNIKDFIEYNPELKEVWCCSIIFTIPKTIPGRV
jgi:hypothetical protein